MWVQILRRGEERGRLHINSSLKRRLHLPHLLFENQNWKHSQVEVAHLKGPSAAKLGRLRAAPIGLACVRSSTEQGLRLHCKISSCYSLGLFLRSQANLIWSYGHCKYTQTVPYLMPCGRSGRGWRSSSLCPCSTSCPVSSTGPTLPSTSVLIIFKIHYTC
jgi:hypothetical protein